VEEVGEGAAEARERLERVLAVAEGDFGLLGGLVVFGRLVEEQVEVLLREEGQVGPFVLWKLEGEREVKG
jgi:hypothetical protein